MSNHGKQRAGSLFSLQVTASRPALSLKKKGGMKAKIIKGFGLPTRKNEP